MRPLTLAATALLAFCTSSCELLKPKEAAAAAYDPYGQQSNPYGQTAAPNPYGSYEQPQTTAAPSPYTAPSQAYSGAADSGRTVTVQSGDTLTSIARRNGTNVAALRSANGISGDLIKIGQKLNLP
jgi:LysM repeat protein